MELPDAKELRKSEDISEVMGKADAYDQYDDPRQKHII